MHIAGDPNAWEKMMALNVLAPMRLTHHVGKAMADKGTGVIINIDSVAGIDPNGPSAVYVASKHAITGWTESVAQVHDYVFFAYEKPVREQAMGYV
jgi:short-subunit dehydrogenase